MDTTQSWLVAILACASSLLVFANAREAIAVSDADEVKIGRILAQKYEAENGIGASEQSRKLDAYLQKVGEKVAQAPNGNFRINFILTRIRGFAAQWVCPVNRFTWEPESWRTWIRKISWQWCWDTKSNM